ncbi:MAG: PAS domain S-box protein, partial [Leptolyngbyaceae cyanobacterium MO_188.B28]|nr:PAS domain S-box protein [Leptolyngbyaceae cyanobacterium MO_188.B28]
MSTDLRGLVNRLQTRLDKMEAVLGAIADAIVWVNSDHRVQGCNTAFDQLVNRPHDAILDAELGQVFPLMYRGRTAPPEEYPTARAIQGDYTVTEYVFQSGQRPLTLEITANLASLTEANRTIVLIIRDVTALAQIRRQAAAIQTSIDGVAVLAPDQTYVYLNQAHASIYGYDTADELIGKSWKVLYGDAEIQRFEQEIMPEFNQQGQWRGEAIGLKRNGDQFHQEISLSALEGGGLTCVVRDISNLKRIEAERKQRENVLRLMVKGMASTTGEAFFQSCVRCLAEVLQVRYAMLGEFVDETKTRVRTLAIQGDRFFAENFEYDLRGTPCERVLQGEMVYYSAGVQTLFPDDLELVEAGVESYLGIPLSNSSNQIIGHLLVMDVKPMPADPGREMVLKIFAARAGAELERRQAETQLRQQQEMLRMVIDAVPNQIFVKDWEGRYLLANQAAADFYNLSVEDIIGQQDAELHPQPAVVERFLQENRQVIETGQELFIPEEKSKTITNQEEWIQWQKRPIRLPGSETQSVLGVGVRITERKQIEEALKKSEARLQLITDSMPACISYIGADYRYRFVNQTYETWFGLNRDQICGMHIRELLGEEAYGVVQKHFERALAGKITHYEVEVPYQRGGSRYTSTTFVPDFDDNACVKGCYGLVIDISDQKRTEEALRRSELKFRNLFENSYVGIFRTRFEDGLVLEANQRCAEILGYSSPTEIVGKKNTTEFWVNPSDRQNILSELYQHGRVDNCEQPFYQRDGSTRWGLCSVRLNTEEGCIEGVLADISDRRRLEEELQQSQKFLHTIVENLPLALFTKDIANDYCYDLINKSSEKILGFSREGAIGRNDYDLLPRELADYYRAQDLAAVDQGELFEFSEQMVSNSQEQLFVRGFKLPLFDDQGNPTHLICVSEDVTERKRREDALRLIVEGASAKIGDEFFKACVRYLAEALQVRYSLMTEFLDEGKKRVRALALWNGDSIQEDFEYSIVGAPCENTSRGQTCYYPHDVQAQFPNCKTLQTMGAESYLGVPMADALGNVRGHLAVMDTHPMADDPGRELILKIFAARAGAELERKQAERALRDSEERFRTIVNNIPGAFYRCQNNVNWTMEFLSEAITDICGYPAADFINDGQVIFNDIIPLADQAGNRRLVEQAIADRQPYVLEYRLNHADGGIRWVYEKGQGIFDESGQVLWLDGVIFDVTDRKLAENLVASQKQVLEMIASGAPLNDTLTVLVQSMESLSCCFAGSILLLDRDGQHLRCGAAPSLPNHYNQAVDGLEIGPKAASCGTSVYQRTPVITPDISTDPRWPLWGQFRGRRRLGYSDWANWGPPH